MAETGMPLPKPVIVHGGCETLRARESLYVGELNFKSYSKVLRLGLRGSERKRERPRIHIKINEWIGGGWLNYPAGWNSYCACDRRLCYATDWH
jgi:hypothetical protein